MKSRQSLPTEPAGQPYRHRSHDLPCPCWARLAANDASTLRADATRNSVLAVARRLRDLRLADAETGFATTTTRPSPGERFPVTARLAINFLAVSAELLRRQNAMERHSQRRNNDGVLKYPPPGDGNASARGDTTTACYQHRNSNAA